MEVSADEQRFLDAASAGDLEGVKSIMALVYVEDGMYRLINEAIYRAIRSDHDCVDLVQYLIEFEYTACNHYDTLRLSRKHGKVRILQYLIRFGLCR